MICTKFKKILKTKTLSVIKCKDLKPQLSRSLHNLIVLETLKFISARTNLDPACLFVQRARERARPVYHEWGGLKYASATHR